MSENPANSDSALSTQNSALDDEEISLLDLLIVLAKHKWLILGLPFVAAILAVIYSLLLPNIYTGTTKILPPQQSQSTAAAMLGQLGGLAGIAGQSLGIKNPNDLYIGMLKSRTVADNLIKRFDLNKLYDEKYQSNTRKQLEQRSTISSGKDGIIVIEVDDKDPKRAAELANAYVDELTKLTGVLAVSEASQRRLFFERQLAQAKENLTAAEIAARQNLEKGGLAKVDDQGRAMVEVTARLRAQISVKEVQIGAMRTFAAERNPELLMVQQELEALKRELSRIEGSSPTAAAISKGGEAGSSGLDNLRRLRDMKYYEIIYELLAKQYELAKIDEARDAALIQVMDKAIEPERKSKPKRALIVILTALVVGFLAIIWAFIKEAGERARQNPEQASRLKTLRGYLRWR